MRGGDGVNDERLDEIKECYERHQHRLSSHVCCNIGDLLKEIERLREVIDGLKDWMAGD